MGDSSTSIAIWFLSFAVAVGGSIVGVVLAVKPKSSRPIRVVGLVLFVAALAGVFYFIQTFPIEINSIEIRPEQ